MEKVSVAAAHPGRAVLLPALMSMALFAAGGLMSVFYFPAAALLVSLKSAVGKSDFLLLLLVAGALVAATAKPAGVALFAAVSFGCIASGVPGRPEVYYRKLFAAFFAGLSLILAGGWFLSLIDSVEIHRAISKIFLFSLAAGANTPSPEAATALAEKAFRIVPAMALILLTAGFLLNLLFTAVVTGKKTAFGRAAKALPVSVYLLSVAIVSAMGREYFAVAYLSENLLTISLFLFFLSGCGIIWSMLMRWGAGRFLSAVVTASLVFVWPAAAAAGVLGRWIRKRGQD